MNKNIWLINNNILAFKIVSLFFDRRFFIQSLPLHFSNPKDECLEHHLQECTCPVFFNCRVILWDWKDTICWILAYFASDICDLSIWKSHSWGWYPDAGGILTFDAWKIDGNESVAGSNAVVDQWLHLSTLTVDNARLKVRTLRDQVSLVLSNFMSLHPNKGHLLKLSDSSYLKVIVQRSQIGLVCLMVCGCLLINLSLV